MRIKTIRATLNVKKSLPGVMSFGVEFSVEARAKSGTVDHEAARGLWDFVNGVVDNHLKIASGDLAIPLPGFPSGLTPDNISLSTGAKKQFAPNIWSFGPEVSVTAEFDPGDDVNICVEGLSKMVRMNMRREFFLAGGKEGDDINLGYVEPTVELK